MKTKLVLWGADAEDQKILIALQLRAEDNLVDVWTFGGEHANMDLHNRLLYEWREGKETAFPVDGYNHYEMELSVTSTILPDTIKTDKADLITRAQTEWHFVVLSTKLYRSYQSELDDLREKVDELEEYNASVWETLKGFWDKVREQLRERNLSRNHGDSIREQTNKLFARMKELNAVLNEAFHEEAIKVYSKYEKIMADIDLKIENDDGLGKVFDELKSIQRDFRKEKLSRDLRSKMWERIDNAFKVVKLKRFGPESVSSNSAFDRVSRRYEGLLNAIKKMKQSISRDEEELEMQKSKIESSNVGQLETQIREAKVKMIEERIRSKHEKLGDMNDTREQLEKQLEKLKTEALVETEDKKAGKIVPIIPDDKKAKTEDTPEDDAEVNKEDSEIETTPDDNDVPEAKDKTKEETPEVKDETPEEIPEVKEDTLEEIPEAKDESKEEISEVKDETLEEISEAKDETKEEIPEVKDETKEEIPEVKDETPEEIPESEDDTQEEIPEVKDDIKADEKTGLESSDEEE